MAKRKEEDPRREEKLPFFETFLPVWVVLCVGFGLLLSQVVPRVSDGIDSIQVGGVSVPIGVCLFFMMYPALLNLSWADMKKAVRYPTPILLTLVSNWIVAPLVGASLAYLIVRDEQQLVVAVLLLSSSPCTAMVLVWGMLAGGNQEQNVIITSINTFTIMLFYAPLVSLLSGIQGIVINRVALFTSVAVFIGGPLVLGLFSKHFLVSKWGLAWFHNAFVPFVSKMSVVALLLTLVVLFALNGEVLLSNPEELLLVSLPLLLGFALVVSFNVAVTRLFGLAYREAVITVIIGSSSHFEIAIATAVGMFGVGSKAALGTTMGLFWEVPVMLGLVMFSKRLRKKGFWKTMDHRYASQSAHPAAAPSDDVPTAVAV